MSVMSIDLAVDAPPVTRAVKRHLRHLVRHLDAETLATAPEYAQHQADVLQALAAACREERAARARRKVSA